MSPCLSPWDLYVCLVCSSIFADLGGKAKALTSPVALGTQALALRVGRSYETPTNEVLHSGVPRFGLRMGRAVRLCLVEWDILLPPTLL